MEGTDGVGGQLGDIHQLDMHQAIGLCSPGWPVLVTLDLSQQQHHHYQHCCPKEHIKNTLLSTDVRYTKIPNIFFGYCSKLPHTHSQARKEGCEHVGVVGVWVGW